MIEPSGLNFGDTVYVVDEKNNNFIKKRITMIDDEGHEWYRYDRPNFEYNIIEIVYCGKVTYQVQGEIRFDEDRRTNLHFKYPDGQIHDVYEDDIEFEENWFYTKEEAQFHIELLKQERW